MQFGICTTIENAVTIQSAGWDYVELGAQPYLQGLVDDDQWTGLRQRSLSPLPTPACNVLLPGTIRVTGPDVDPAAQRQYMTRVLQRAQKVGVEIIVFGSGGARNVPAGFDWARARQQIVDFVRLSADIAATHGVTIVAEPLNAGECNIINSVPEAMEYVHAVNHPNFQCLADSYHFWLEDDSLEELRKAMPGIRHVHVADKVGRVPPGQSGSSDYRPFFRVLKQGGYDGRISVEAGSFPDLPATAPRVLEFLKSQWAEA